MKKYLPLLCIISTLVIALNSPRSPAQIQPVVLKDLQPPQLLTPENGSKLKDNPEFFWTSAVLPKGFRGSYKLKIVPLSPDQDPSAAIAGNPPLHQAVMRRTGEVYPPDGPLLKNGQTYAWCVQVVDANGSPVGGNQGMSDVFTFSFETVPQSPPAASPTPGIQNAVIHTEPFEMTGMRVESVTINTRPFEMTGTRVESISIDTKPFEMTGMRVESVTIHTDTLVMIGMRGTDQSSSGGDDLSHVKPEPVKKAKQKMDLPLKKPKTVHPPLQKKPREKK